MSVKICYIPPGLWLDLRCQNCPAPKRTRNDHVPHPAHRHRGRSRRLRGGIARRHHVTGGRSTFAHCVRGHAVDREGRWRTHSERHRVLPARPVRKDGRGVREVHRVVQRLHHPDELVRGGLHQLGLRRRQRRRRCGEARQRQPHPRPADYPHSRRGRDLQFTGLRLGRDPDVRHHQVRSHGSGRRCQRQPGRDRGDQLRPQGHAPLRQVPDHHLEQLPAGRLRLGRRPGRLHRAVRGCRARLHR